MREPFSGAGGRSSRLWHIVNKKPGNRRLAELFIWSKALLGAEVGAGRTGLSRSVVRRAAFRDEDLNTAGPASSKAKSGVYLFMTSSVIITTVTAERSDGAGLNQGLCIGGEGFHPLWGNSISSQTSPKGDGRGPDSALPGAGWAPMEMRQESSIRGADSSRDFAGSCTALCSSPGWADKRPVSPSEHGLAGI